MTSLPVPLSPEMNTEASVAATFRARSTALRKVGEIPISEILSLWPPCLASCCLRSRVSRATMTAWEARPISTCRWVAENGFGR